LDPKLTTAAIEILAEGKIESIPYALAIFSYLEMRWVDKGASRRDRRREWNAI